MKSDIGSSEDINLLVRTFYTRVMDDDILAPIFVMQNFDLDAHLPVMISFWEGILLDLHSYKGNPVRVHQQLNAVTPLLSAHFERWLSVWTATARHLFEGSTTEEAIFRAKSIASVMEAKLSAG